MSGAHHEREWGNEPSIYNDTMTKYIMYLCVLVS